MNRDKGLVLLPGAPAGNGSPAPTTPSPSVRQAATIPSKSSSLAAAPKAAHDAVFSQVENDDLASLTSTLGKTC